MRLRAGRPAGADRGSVTVFTAVFALAVIFLLALILDGGVAMNAKQRAADIAGQAARAAADDVNQAELRGGTVAIAPGACAVAAGLVHTYASGATAGVDRLTSATMTACTAPAGATAASVTVTITTRPLVPGIFGSLRETARVSATTRCGVTRGGVCP